MGRRRIWKNKKRESLRGSGCDLCPGYANCEHTAHNKSQENWLRYLSHGRVSEMWLRGSEIQALKHFYCDAPKGWE